MNAVHLLGRLVADPELRTTPNGDSVCRFRIAVQKTKDKSDFFNVTAWDKTAEFVNQYFQKGERILLTGNIHNADYKDKNGVAHYAVDILATHAEFIELKKSEPPQGAFPTEKEEV